MDAMEEIKQTFFQECEELLEALEADLILLNEGAGNEETINAVFRAVHSIKGGAGAFALESLVRFAHKFETTLDEVRAGRLDTTPDVMSLFLRGGDMLADLVIAARDDMASDDDAIDSIITELAELTGSDCAVEKDVAADDEEEFEFQPLAISFDFDDDDEEDDARVDVLGANIFTIEFCPHPSLYANGNEASLLLRALRDLGAVEIACDYSTLPGFDDIDPHGAYFSWTIVVTTDEDIDEVRDVFDFVDGVCVLSIMQACAPEENLTAGALSDVAEGISSVNDVYVAEPDVEPEEITEQAAIPIFDEPVTKITNVVEKTPEKLAKKAAPSGPKATVRVDLERVDRLINLVGELVINQAMLTQCLEEAETPPSTSVMSGMDEFRQLTRDIQESVMAIRAQPVKPLFQRMSRIIREASDATGKKVRLHMEGDATEVDKTVVERLADPLTHMIRNAVDHGLETSDKRLANGKSEEGTVRLSAAHRSGRVVIEVADDGAGINRERVKSIAIEKGLVSADAEMSNSEIDNLLFMPGFSTASSVSDLSGRGVGMDVVKRAIQALGGRVVITSEPNVGTTFSISLPLTLAVLDGMVVRVGDQTLVVPITAILETLRPSPDDIHEMVDGTRVVFLRGKFVPIIDTGVALGYRTEEIDFGKCVVLLIEGADGGLSAIAVDGIQDQRQVVIKGLDDNYGHVPGIAAATILGDGRIALIVDPDALIVTHNNVGEMQLAETLATGVVHV